jgi:hypothetical protein
MTGYDGVKQLYSTMTPLKHRGGLKSSTLAYIFLSEN